MDIEITPQTDDFMIHKDKANKNDYKFELVNIKLYVKTLDLMDGLALCFIGSLYILNLLCFRDVARRLDTQPARYSLKKTMLKSYFISENRMEFTTNIFTDEVPRRIIIAMVDQDAYIGNKDKSPFNFKNFDVRDISIIASGRQYPQTPYDLDYANNKYARAYHDMQENLGCVFSRDSNGISYKMFKNGWNIYVFNLTNSIKNEPGFELIREGTTAKLLRSIFVNAK